VTRTTVAAALTLAVLGIACSSNSTTVSKPSGTTSVPSSTSPRTTPSTTASGGAACTPVRAATAGQTEHHFTYDNLDRTYLQYVPKGYDGTKPVPLVLEFHGYGSNAREQINYGNFKPEADRDTFIVVAPNGGSSAGGRHFDLVKDVGMTGALLDRLEKELCIDAKRVYATGMSDGGAMTSFLACRPHDRIAAFGPVALTIQPFNCPAGNAPIMAFHGTADPVVRFNGGKVNCCGGIALPAIPTALAKWAKRNGCSPTPTDSTVNGEVTKRTWSGCANGDVTFFIINGGGHTWPGSPIDIGRLGKTTHQIDASKTLWDFFQTQSLP
jgi:polyhydroxybutyrate depolymerase